MTDSLDFRVEWLNAPGVTTPELAATWARYEVWLGTRCVTQVEAADGTFRRGVYGSLYPLAYWVAANWWVLTSHVRPSAIDTRYWTWRNAGIYPWLRQHNFRAAGDGMPWPDLTVVPEGTVTRFVWRQDYQHQAAPVRFASDGWQLLKNSDFRTEMAAIVSVVLDRLAESGLPKTPLAEEWSAIAQADADEREFCETAARMGLDPYSVEDETADVIVRTAGELPPEIAGDFFDSADVSALADAADWARRAMGVAGRASAKAAQTIEAFQEASTGQDVSAAEIVENERPWIAGYELARMLRRELEVIDTDQFDISPWVGVGNVSGSSHGIQGFAIVSADRCGVVLGDQYSGTTARRFGQARALGRILARPGQQQFVLSAARSQDEKVARAFAAELLAPATGIRSILDAIGRADDSAMEVAARRFQVSLVS